MDSKPVYDPVLYDLMETLKDEVVEGLMKNLNPIKDPKFFVYDHYLFEPLYEDLNPILKDARNYHKILRRIGRYEFVKTNFGKTIYLLNRSTNVTPENLVALTFSGIRKIIQHKKESGKRNLMSETLLDYQLVNRTFERDYRLLESLLVDKNISYTSSCLIRGVTGPKGEYRIGDYDIEIKSLRDDPKLIIVSVKHKNSVNKEEIIFNNIEPRWDDDSAKEDFLELIAIMDLLRPPLTISLDYPKFDVELLTLPYDAATPDIFESMRILGYAQAQLGYVKAGFKYIDISEILPEAQELWQQIHSVKGAEGAKLISALRRLAMGTLRNSEIDLIVDYVVSLETLLIKHSNTEISYRLKLMAGLLTKNSDETMKFIEEMYRARSGNIHSNAPLKADLSGNFVKARLIMSEVFREFIRVSNSLNGGSVYNYLDNAIVGRAKDKLAKNGQPSKTGNE